MRPFYLYLLIIFCFSSCSDKKSIQDITPLPVTPATPYLVVLGIAQDAGFPQANCKKECCRQAWQDNDLRKSVSCIALVDPANEQAWIFDATPSFKDQLQMLASLGIHNIAGIFLTHAHIGHYTGLMHLGREAMGANNIPVYAMPKMKTFLETNGPWSQLVTLNNINLIQLKADSIISLGEDLTVSPFQVPHRDEFSETVGFRIGGNHRSALFIPDIDKWQKWNRDIKTVISENDVALLDGSFFQNGEIPGRDMALIPHPFITESMDLFQDLTDQDKSKVHFIHFNHTNPVLQKNSPAYNQVKANGFAIAEELQVFKLSR